MKVKMNQTEDVSDEQRAQIGATLGKRQASREECRDFIWRHGRDWAELLDRAEQYQAEAESDPIPGMELI